MQSDRSDDTANSPDQSAESGSQGAGTGGSVPTASGSATALIQVASKDPHARAAGSEAGKAVYTITRTINHVLLPLALINSGLDKTRDYFNNKFTSEIAEKTEDIPQERLVEPKASVAAPALQGLAVSHEEDELRDMYLNLLRSAMDSATSDKAHPAFARIIEQLTAEEARVLNGVLQNPSTIRPIAQVKLTDKSYGGHIILYHHLLDLVNSQTRERQENPRAPAMVDNWERLGLVDFRYDAWLTQEGAYAWVEERPEYQRLKSKHDNDEQKVEYDKGMLRVTNLGQQFASVVAHHDGEQPVSS